MQQSGSGSRARGRRVLLLWNPAAGRGSAADAVLVLHERFAALGYSPIVVSGPDRERARAALRSEVRRGADALVVLGGDGLVHLALQEVAQTSIPMSIVPLGSGNDIARACGIPLRTSTAIAHALRVCTRRVLLVAPVDLLRARSAGSECWVGGSISFGVDAAVNERANALPRWVGAARYVLATVRELFAWRPVRLTPMVAGTVITEAGLMTLCTVSNIPTIGGGIPIAPTAVIDDGLAELTVAGAMPAWRVAMLFPALLRGKHLQSSRVQTQRVTSLTFDIVAGPGRQAYGDGEPLPPALHRIDIVAGALSILQ